MSDDDVQDSSDANDSASEDSGENGEDSQAEQVSAENMAKQKRAAKKKVFAPELALIDPKPRTFSNSSLINNPPCGNSEKGLVHYMATPGSRNFI